MLIQGSSSTYSPYINHSGRDNLTKIFFELQYFGPDLRLTRTKSAIQIRSVKNADCRPGTKCRLQTGYKMQIENLYCFFAWYVVTCHLTTYRASRNRFSPIIFLDYFHYCGIFLARFLITIVLNIISSLPVVFSLCARGGWRGTCSEYTNLIKVDVDVNEMSLFNNFSIFEKKMSALHVVHTFHLYNRYVYILLKTVLSTWYSFNV